MAAMQFRPSTSAASSTAPPIPILATRPEEPPRLVLEFGGAYDAARVERFHEDCAERRLPYQLW